jgi:uncharacterized RDD family membrane protein YckC
MTRQFIAHNYPNASLTKRLLAMLYDLFLLISIWMLVGFISVALNGGEAVTNQLEQAMLGSALFVITFTFYAWFWTHSGQTLGMQVWHIRLENHQHQTINSKQALVRFMAAIPALGLAGFGYLWILFSAQKLSWHDHYSETRVVQLPRPS